MNSILLITASNNLNVTVVGPLTIDDAKKGQRDIIAKIPEGSATVVIDTVIPLEDYLKTL
jgi:hypothetical protein